MENQIKSYEDMTVKELIVVIDEKDEKINELESDIELKDSEIYDLNDDISTKAREISNLNNKINDLENKLEEFEDLDKSDVIIKQINLLTTDEVAKIYYAIQESYHFQHLDKFKPL